MLLLLLTVVVCCCCFLLLLLFVVVVVVVVVVVAVVVVLVVVLSTYWNGLLLSNSLSLLSSPLLSLSLSLSLSLCRYISPPPPLYFHQTLLSVLSLLPLFFPFLSHTISFFFFFFFFFFYLRISLFSAWTRSTSFKTLCITSSVRTAHRIMVCGSEGADRITIRLSCMRGMCKK